MKQLKTFLYWLGWLTWGLPITIIGALVALTLIICGKKPKTFCGGVYFNIKDNWGGVEFGPFFIMDNSDSLSTKQHERGHGNQLIFGPLFPFFVSIPSALRYWCRRINNYKNKKLFGIICCSLLFIIIGGLVVLSIILSINWLLIVTSILLVYVITITVWINCFEIPKYKNLPYPDYDDFWIEGWATKSGKKTCELPHTLGNAKPLTR